MLYLDSSSLVVVYIVKFIRFLLLWMVLFVMEKVAIDRYVTRVLIYDKSPQQLARSIVIAIAVEALLFLFVVSLLFLISARYNHPRNTFVIDGGLIQAILKDYLVTTLLIMNIGIVLGTVVQNKVLFRFQHDGLRGTRAYTYAMFYVALIVLAIPFYII